jgi:aminoglycoside phosphotransferase (APT) family kinase protein
LAAFDRRSAVLLREIEEIGASVPESLAGDDLVHFDFHAENVLVDAEGAVTGVVDWGAVGRGHFALDLFTLRFDVARRACGLGPLMDEALRAVPDEVAMACWAHMSLRQVDWSIRHHTPADTAAWLDIAGRLRP